MTLLDLMTDETRPAFSFTAAEPRPAAKPAAPLNRTFWRCADCLSIMAIDGESTTAKLFCGGCGGACECMGRVQRQRLTSEHLRPICDGRCTSAMGPSCDCKCGGSHHGSGLLVLVTVDKGGVPRIKPLCESKSLRQATEYRTTLDAAKNRLRTKYGAAMDAKRAGGYVDGRTYATYAEGMRAYGDLARAKALRTHLGRLKALENIQ